MQYFRKDPDPLERKIPLGEAIKEYDESFEKRWRYALAAFDARTEDTLAIIGPSSYLLKLGGTRIAIDPQIRRESDLERVKDTIVPFFSRFDAILITHEHDDHFDIKLSRLLRDTGLTWYLPEGIKPLWVEKSELRPESIRYASPEDVFTLGGVRVHAFDSPHKPFDADWEMAERGYEITAEGGRLLFPGDIREYAYDAYPPMQGADLCFAHVWAGNNTVDPDEYMPRMKKAADFFARFAAKKYFLCHLYEIGRTQHVMWDTEHAEILSGMLKERLPGITAKAPTLGRLYNPFTGEEI